MLTKLERGFLFGKRGLLLFLNLSKVDLVTFGRGRKKGKDIMPWGMRSIYVACLTDFPIQGSVKFFVALHVRQSNIRLTDPRTAQIRPIEVCSKEWVGWGFSQRLSGLGSGLLHPARTRPAP